MIAALSATIALVLFLIGSLNHPFAGLVCVEPAAFHQLWNIIDQWAATIGGSEERLRKRQKIRTHTMKREENASRII